MSELPEYYLQALTRAKKIRDEYEANWTKYFAIRLSETIAVSNLSIPAVAEYIESTPERILTLLRGEDFPTIVEVTRLARINYGHDEKYLFGLSY